MMDEQRLLLVSSDELPWCALRATLREIPEVSVTGDVHNVQQARRLAEAGGPEADVVLAAPEVAGSCMLPLLTTIRGELWPASKLLILAGRYESTKLRCFADLGTAGYLLWHDLTADVMRSCLAAITARSIVVTSEDVVQAFIQAECSVVSAPALTTLTTRELLVLRAMAEGRTQDEIALHEGWSSRSVSRVVTRLEEKLDAPSQFTLGMKAAQYGLLDTSGDDF